MQDPLGSVPSTNPNLGFQDKGGVHYLSTSSIGSDVPDPVLVEENPEDLLDDDDDLSGPSTFSCCGDVWRVLKAMSGGRTSFLMTLLMFIVFLFCTLSAEVHDEPQAFLLWTVMFIYLIVTLQLLHCIRWLWKKLVVQLAFPDSRSLPFITDAIDPRFWILAWAIIQYATWQTLLEPSDDGLWSIPVLPESWPLQDSLENNVEIVKLAFVVVLLWAIRDVLVQVVMVKLLLGFLMNFNDEVIALFHKYSLLRRLNAGWIRLVPFSVSEMKDTSMTTLLSVMKEPTQPTTHLQPPQQLQAAQMTMARTAAMMRREGSKMQLMDVVKAREDSKNRLAVGQSNTKEFLKFGSILRQSSKVSKASSDRISIKIDHVDDNKLNRSPSSKIIPSPSKKRMFPPYTTAAQKRRKVREFHVEMTGRALPPLLEKDNIYALAKSRLLNMISINWIKRDPIIFFVDGQRTELTSKKVARLAASQIFESLLQFRQSIAAIEEELAEEEAAATTFIPVRTRPSVEAPPTPVKTVPPESSSDSDGDVSVQVTEAAAPVVTLISEAQQQATPPPQPDSSSASDYGSNEPKVPYSGDRRVKWFHRGRKTPESVGTPTAKATPSSMFSKNLSPNLMGKPFTEAHLAAITAAEIKKVKVIMPDDRDCLTQDFFELFMSPQDAKELMEFLDPGKLGKVTSKMFLKGVVTVYRLRKQMVTSLEAQEEIEATFRRVCLYLFTIVAVLIWLIVLGVNANTIIISGAAVLSAISLILSFVYTDFIQSIILIVFLNPYRIGDRVRIDGEAQYVKRITTYFTEFESLHGKVQYISHKELSNKLLINESRCKVATTEIAVLFSEKTTPSQYASLKKVLDAYLKSRPLEWIGDSLFMFIQAIGPSQFIEVSIWATHTESWGNWMAIRTQESAFFHFIMRQATVLGMYYRLPIQRWEPSTSSPSHLVPSTYGGIAHPSHRQPSQAKPIHPVFEHTPQHGSAYPDDDDGDPSNDDFPSSSVGWEMLLNDENDERIERLEDERDERLLRRRRR